MRNIASILMLWYVVSIHGATSTPFQLVPDPTDCTKFSIHMLKFKWEVSCDAGKVFSRKISNCVLQNGPYDDCSNRQQNQPSITIRAYEDVFNYCAQCPTCLYPDANNCAGFYNCSKILVPVYSRFRQFEDECVYPALFDADALRCERDYKKVEGNCGGRPLLLYPCDQKRFKCVVAHCRPCEVTYPNCAGKSDGFHEWEDPNISPYFTRCQDGRTIKAERCDPSGNGTPSLFSCPKPMCRCRL
ncbi:hypothetical protein SNE40_015436 [Patella caerulea]|uniref:Uncharacterized protein n=1 Tax=Patella caerulea TaxID=87958 RepID=A0AAN8JHZ4_PATCE